MSSSCVFSDHFFISVPVSGIRRTNRLASFQTQFFTVLNLATGAPSTAADHVCWQGWNLFLLANLRDSQISTSLIHLKPERPGVVRDATLMRFHTQTLRRRQEEALSLARSSVISFSWRNPSIQELIPKFHSVNLSVLRA